jgi:predicted thioredoxin/glutaredoxin
VIATRLFRELGFALCRATPAMFWLANAKTSPELLVQIVSARVTAL